MAFESGKPDILFGEYEGSLYRLSPDDRLTDRLTDVARQSVKRCYMGATYGFGSADLPHSTGIRRFTPAQPQGFELPVPADSYLYLYTDSLAARRIHCGVVYTLIEDLRSGEIIRTIDNYQELGFNPIVVVRDKYNRYIFSNTNRSAYTSLEGIKIPARRNDCQLSGGFISCARDKQGDIWYGNSEGLYRWDYKQEIRILPADNSPYTSLCIYQNKYLIAPSGQKVNIIDLEAYQAGTQYLRVIDCGLEEPQQNAILPDPYRRGVWISFLRGMAFVPEHLFSHDDPAPCRPIVYSVLHGNDKQQYRTKHQSVFGFDRMLCDTVDRHTTALRLQIGYIDPSRSFPQQYRYRINQNNWSEPSANTQIDVTNLEPGAYSVELIVDGDPPAKVYSLYITPALWQETYMQVLILLLSIALLSGLSIWIWQIRERKNRIHLEARARASETALQALKNRLNPHFLFSALNSIGSIILNEAPAKAYEAVCLISKIIRSLLPQDQTKDESHTLEQELEVCNQYIQLQQLRFGEDKIRYTVHKPEDLDLEIPIPKLIIQIPIENAVRHGILPLKRDGRIDLYLSPTMANSLEIKIVDDGVGLHSHNPDTKGHGVGLAALRHIIQAKNESLRAKYRFGKCRLCKKEKRSPEASLSVCGFPDKGSTVKINWPLADSPAIDP